MRKLVIFFICLSVCVLISSLVINAESPVAVVSNPTNTNSLLNSTPSPINNGTVLKETAGVTPESILYPIERILESIQVTLTFSSEGKAELLVSMANERIAEAKILTEKSKEKLVDNIIEVYVKTIEEANEEIKNAAEDDKDVTDVIAEIKVIEDTADKFVLEVKGKATQEIGDTLKNRIVSTVNETVLVQALDEAKSKFKDTLTELKQTQDELNEVKKSGNEFEIKTALDNAEKAKEYKEQIEKMKNEVEKYKKEIESFKKESGKCKFEEEAKNDSKVAFNQLENPSEVNNRFEKLKGLIELINKQKKLFEEEKGKRQIVIKKLIDQPESNCEKLKENTEKLKESTVKIKGNVEKFEDWKKNMLEKKKLIEKSKNQKGKFKDNSYPNKMNTHKYN